MGILLLILKTAGILLLTLFGLIILAVVLFLFYPIRYRGTGTLQEGGRLEGKVSVTWLARLIHFRMEYEDGLRWEIRVAGILVWPRRQKKKAKSTERKTAQGNKREMIPEEAKGIEQKERTAPITPDAPAEPQKEAAGRLQQEEGKKPVLPDKEQTSQERSKEQESPPRGLKAKLQKWIDSLGKLLLRIKAAFADLAGTLERIAARAEALRETCLYYKELLTREETKELLRKAMYHIKKLFAHVKPRTLEGAFTVGTNDPASTANILAAWGMLYPALGENISLVPDFEKARAEGELFIEGRIRTCIVLYHTLKLLLDKKNQEFIRQLRRRK